MDIKFIILMIKKYYYWIINIQIRIIKKNIILLIITLKHH